MSPQSAGFDVFVPADHRDEIAAVAYAFWEESGCTDGHDVEDWLLAEQEVGRRYRSRSEVRQQANAA